MKILNKILLPICVIGLTSFSSVFAWWIDHFEVRLEPKDAKVWEALDLTIEAVDKNNAIVSDYNWIILIFSESDPEAELPSVLEENTYTFSDSDQWKIKFENGVYFKKTWTNDVHIYDLEDDTVLWIAEVNITKEEEIKNIDVSILTPEDWLTIWEWKIKVSWNTKKNYNIKIIINWKREELTTSNNEWLFERVINNLEAWDNAFKAQVLNSDNIVVWESNIVKIKVNSNLPSLKSIKVTPKEVDTESEYEIEVITDKWLTEVNIIIDDSIIKLEDKGEWVYFKKAYAPKNPWVYKIDVVLKDDLWHEIKELWSWILTVNKIELKVAEEIKEEVLEVVEVKSAEEKKELIITWLKLIELKSKSVLTWDKLDDAESYNVYKKVNNKDKNDNKEETDWIDESDKFELIENIKTNKFEIDVIWDEIKYDYFAIKAIWKTSTWETYEWTLSDATKIKTWPELLILLILSILVWSFVFILKSKKS